MTIPITGLDLIGEIFLLSSSPLLWAWKAVSPLSNTSQWKRIVSWSKRDGGGIGRRQIARPTSHAPADLDGAHPASAPPFFWKLKKQNKTKLLTHSSFIHYNFVPPFLQIAGSAPDHMQSRDPFSFHLMQNRSRR